MQYKVGDHVQLADGSTGFVTDVCGGAGPEGPADWGSAFTVSRIGQSRARVGYDRIRGKLDDPQFAPGTLVTFGGKLAEVVSQTGRNVRLRFSDSFKQVPLYQLVIENGGTEEQS